MTHVSTQVTTRKIFPGPSKVWGVGVGGKIQTESGGLTELRGQISESGVLRWLEIMEQFTEKRGRHQEGILEMHSKVP